MSRVIKNTIIYTVASQISRISALLSLPFITPYLNAVDYGIWGVLQAYLGLTQSLSFLGLYIVLTNSYYNNPLRYKWVWRQVYGFLSIWMPIFGILNALFLYIVMPNEAIKNSFEIILLLTLPLVLFGPVSKIAEIKYQLDENSKSIAWRAMILGICGVILNIYLIRILRMGYMGWIWSSFITNILLNMSYFYPLVIKNSIKPIYNFKWKTIKRALVIGLPTVPHKYATYFLKSSDRVVMDRLRLPIQEIGAYNVANSFGAYFSNITLGFEKAVSPMLYRNFKKGLNVNKDITSAFIFFITLAFLYGIWSKEIFHVLIRNSDLSKYYFLSIILVFSETIRPYYSVFSAHVSLKEKIKYLWVLTLSIGLLNIILNLILIPKYGFEFAAYSTLFCNIIFAFSGSFIKYFSFDLFRLKDITRAVIILCVGLFSAFFIVEFSPSSKILISAPAIFFILYELHSKVKR